MYVDLKKAVSILEDGGVVVVPTDTVYGLAAKMSDEGGVRKIFELKGRPENKPLIIQISDVSQVYDIVEKIPPGFDDLTKIFWPGALTLVVPIKVDRVPDIVRAGKTTAGFRIPNNETTRKLLSEVGPLVVPSANISGRPAHIRSEDVEKDFGVEIPILEGENLACGIASTILEFHDAVWRVLRFGAITSEEISRVVDSSILSL